MTASPVQRGPRSNGIERVLHIPQRFKTEASPSDAVQWQIQNTHCVGGSYLSCNGAVCVFYGTSRLGCK